MSFDYTTLVRDRTQADVFAKNEKGTYNAADLNRVTAALDDLYTRFASAGYVLSRYAVVLNREWTDEDVPTQGQMAQYLINVEDVRSAFSVLATTPITPVSMELLTWAKANDIEQILMDVDTILNALTAIYLRSDMIWAYSGGTGFYFMN